MPDPAPIPGALSDVRVLDLSDRLSAAFCSKLMGDQGADVVLIEDGETGHVLRREPPFLDDIEGSERSLLHAYANLNKRSVQLDAGDPRRASLVRAADIIVVSSRTTADEVRRDAAPGAIIVAATPYGLDTPMTDTPGNDLTAAAATGWALINGDEGQPPLRPTLHQSAYMAGSIAYTGAIAALVERDRSGVGQTVDVCELEPLVWMGAPNVLSAAHGDAGPGRARPGVFRGPVATQDGHISVTFSRPHFWVEAMRALRLDDLADDPKYTNRANRVAEAAPLQQRIEAALAERESWDLFEDLSARRCTVGVVMTMHDLATNEHLATRHAFAETIVDGQPVTTLASPCEMSATPWTMRSPAPRLGEHTPAVLADWLAEAEVSR